MFRLLEYLSLKSSTLQAAFYLEHQKCDGRQPDRTEYAPGTTEWKDKIVFMSLCSIY